jgi:hypothetical protein
MKSWSCNTHSSAIVYFLISSVEPGIPGSFFASCLAIELLLAPHSYLSFSNFDRKYPLKQPNMQRKDVDDSQSLVADFPFQRVWSCAILIVESTWKYAFPDGRQDYLEGEHVMKRLGFLLPILLGCAALVGCGPAKASPAVMNAVSAATDTSVPAIPQGWKEIGRSQLMDSMGALHYAGFFDAQHGIAVGYAGGIHFTSDGGATWQVGANDSMCLFGLEIVDANTAYTCGNGKNIRTTKDGGKTWTARADWGDMEPQQCRYLSFVDANTGWAANPTSLAATKDGGATWQAVTLSPMMNGILGLSLVSADEGFLMDANGNLFHTADGGKNWLMISSAFGVAMGINPHIGLNQDRSPLLAVRFQDVQHGLIAFRNAVTDPDGKTTVDIRVMRTEDGGLNFSSETLPGFSANYMMFLSRDGKYLTLTDTIKTEIIVLQYS